MSDTKQMATENPVSGQAEEKSANPGVVDVAIPSSKKEGSKESTSDWPFKNSEPIREDQVQNAVRFLQHPKVQGSPVVHRRNFLERKGLTREEIEEAFRRVPDSPPDVHANSQVQTQDKQTMPVATLPTQQLVNMPQQTMAAMTITGKPPVHSSNFNWKNVTFAVGLLVAAGAGTGILFKKFLIPKLKDWVRKVAREAEDQEQIVAEEAATAAKSAAEATSAVAAAIQELLKARNEDRKHFEGLVQTLEEQIEEMKFVKTSLQGSQAGTYNSTSRSLTTTHEVDQRGIDHRLSKGLKANTNIQPFNQSSERPASAPANVLPSYPQHSKSYMEILDMVSRGEKPPGIKEINDKPPNPNQTPSASQLQPIPKPWEGNQAHHMNRDTFPAYNGVSEVQKRSSNPLGSQSSNAEPLWKRKPIDSETRPTKSQVPVSRNAVESVDDGAQGNTLSAFHPTGISSRTYDGKVFNSSPNMTTRSWVPPPVPSLAMPQAAEAIRNPKYRPMKEQVETNTEDERISSSSNQNQDSLESNTKEMKEYSAVTESNSFDGSLQEEVVKDVNEEETEGAQV